MLPGRHTPVQEHGCCRGKQVGTDAAEASRLAPMPPPATLKREGYAGQGSGKRVPGHDTGNRLGSGRQAPQRREPLASASAADKHLSERSVCFWSNTAESKAHRRREQGRHCGRAR